MSVKALSAKKTPDPIHKNPRVLIEPLFSDETSIPYPSQPVWGERVMRIPLARHQMVVSLIIVSAYEVSLRQENRVKGARTEPTSCGPIGYPSFLKSSFQNCLAKIIVLGGRGNERTRKSKC